MGEESLTTVPFDRTVEQAILAMKKGAQLLKCGRRGKPKFCPFRLSTDEKYLIWYSGQEEKQLRLSLVTKIVTGQRTRQLQPDKENQSFSLLYTDGDRSRSLDLICKDNAQADSWFIGLRAVMSKCHHARPFCALKNHRVAQSCVNSPAGFIRRKYNLGILEDDTEMSQVHSLHGSPTQSISDRGFADGLSLSSDSLCFSEASLPLLQTVEDFLIPCTPNAEPQNIKKNGSDNGFAEFQKNMCRRIIGSNHGSQRTEKNDVLKDVLIWGEGAEGGNIGCVGNQFGYHSTLQVDSLLPKLLEPTMMLDVRNISLGRNHAALITKRGEVFCWGEGSRGKLGHKIDMDVSSPTIVESLDGFLVKSVACGEYQTCALTDSGELFVWGENKYGGNLVCEERTGSQWLPRQISGPLAGISISNVACGDWHTAAVSSSGQLFTYGDGTFGVLGHGNLQSLPHPKEVESLKGLWVKSVACGSWHTAAIVDVIFYQFKFNGVGGKLFTWGDGDKGRLGHADLEKKLQPTCVAQLVEHDFVQVSCGRMLTVALTRTGKIYTMGSSVHGQLGNPQAKDKSIAIVEGKLKEELVKEISSGSYHVAALTSGGSVYTWGKGTNGQLGLGNVEDRNVPTLVEALRDRQVQSIACGSNLTAAICLHKSISVSDQSACKGCRMPFGFTRKKHNCYNCGLLFCRACSSKKLINASLAPKKSKLCRVCDSCFNSSQRITHPGGGSRKLVSQQKALSDEKEERGGATPPGHRLQLMSQPSLESQPGERKTSRNQGEKQQHLETASSISAGLPRWGQVSCPAIFESCYRKDSVHPLEPISSSSLNLEEDKHESNNILVEEVKRLRAQAKGLEIQCQAGSQKIQECQQTIEKTWLLAREEAAKRKAANGIIKALVLRLHAMSDKGSVRNGAEDGGDPYQPQTRPDYADTPTVFASTRSPLRVRLPKDCNVDSLSSSPIVFSNSLKSLDGRELCHENSMPGEDLHDTTTDPRRKGTNASKLEWVEQYEPGVYITFTVSPGGEKGLKRVRFSRKRFAEKEAGRWWEENEAMVYQHYGIEGYNKSNQNQEKS
ncbi:PREDICTED: uncharacterized protein LOC105139209 [Populus euphratica]|uniref:Uncharacterized protein LOC105139209 n=1 Tax=Populus euphratica TaxID=75702 RepID=A0AAJ6V941_POPEU|nr:PREDICTED: uncharacterized protein LOC105139209 [Populus euphratica]